MKNRKFSAGIELVDRLRAELDYSVVTGQFFWREARGRQPQGAIAASLRNEGYLTIKIERAGHLAHRLAWFYMTGEWPPEQCDHINGVRSCNAWHNLRCVSNAENAQNLGAAKPQNKAGFLGVSRSTQRPEMFVAQITARGVHYWLGEHPTPEAAHAAYIAAKTQLHEAWKRADQLKARADQLESQA
jgi:hypothetical protein